MDLHEVPRGSRVRVIDQSPDHEVRTPVASKGLKPGDEFIINRIDGMYSHCVMDDGTVVHPAAWTTVEIVESKTK